MAKLADFSIIVAGSFSIIVAGHFLFHCFANGFNSYFTTIASKLNDCDDGILIEPLKTFNDFI